MHDFYNKKKKEKKEKEKDGVSRQILTKKEYTDGHYDRLQRSPLLERSRLSGSFRSSSSYGSFRSSVSPPQLPPPRSGSSSSSESSESQYSPGTVIYESLGNQLPHTPPGSTPNATYAVVNKDLPKQLAPRSSSQNC